MDFAHRRAEQLRDFVDLCKTVGFRLEPFQVKIAGALLGEEREKVITLPRKNWQEQGYGGRGDEVAMTGDGSATIWRYTERERRDSNPQPPA